MENERRIATVGTFDGLHRGHDLLLTRLAEEARARNLKPLVLTFDRHPLSVIAPERAPKMLMDADTRDRLIRARGLEVKRLQFTEALRGLTAAEWLQRLADDYGVEALVLGYDNTFGSDCMSLSSDDYRRLGHQAGIEVIVADALPGYSSSAARRALMAGDTRRAAEILGRPYTVEGNVVHGRGLGRTIGVPTANIAVPPTRLLPSPGVYAARAVAPGVDSPAVVNIGHAPTVREEQPLTVEAHLIDFDADLYGREIELQFDRRLRDERRFPDLAALRAQIQADIAATAPPAPAAPPVPSPAPTPVPRPKGG